MRPFLFSPLAALLLILPARAASLAYEGRLVHNNRSAVSSVSGVIDLESGDFAETVDQSWAVSWETLPASLSAERPSLPSVWRKAGTCTQQLASAVPRSDSPLLRHFVCGEVLARAGQLRPGNRFLSEQLEVTQVEVDAQSIEVIGRFRGSPLVLVGKMGQCAGLPVVTELAVLGAAGELYHYFLDSAQWQRSEAPARVEPPRLDPARYVSFPGGEPGAVPVTAVKDWLVFEAQLPGGRKLNLLLDSGSDTMILDDMVLELDAHLRPQASVDVEGALAGGTMKLYEGFSFEAGGVQFRDLTVLGTGLTSVAVGAGIRIHGIVGGDVLSLCRLDVDLEAGRLRLYPPGSVGGGGQEVDLTFIQQLPHIEAQFEGAPEALFLLDTGQRSAVSVNMDYLEGRKLDGELVMNGFLGDLTGGLLPRYMLENKTVALAGQSLTERTVDAGAGASFNFAGRPVAGSIGFALLAKHFGGFTFDYSQKLLYLRPPGEAPLIAALDPQAAATAGATQRLDGALAQASGEARPAAGTPAFAAPRPAMAPPAPATAGPERLPRERPDWRRYDVLRWADPEAMDPAEARRAKYAWSGNKGNLSDPLGLVARLPSAELRLLLDSGLPAPGASGEALARPADDKEDAARRLSLLEALRLTAQKLGAMLLRSGPRPAR